MKLKPKIKVSAIELIVSDLEKSLNWYREKLGAHVVAEYKEWKCVNFKIGKSEVVIDMGQPDPSWGKEEYKKAKERIGKSTGIMFETDDINETYRVLKEKGVKFIQPPTKTNWGEVRAIFVDPDGNEFKIFESSNKSLK